MLGARSFFLHFHFHKNKHGTLPQDSIALNAQSYSTIPTHIAGLLMECMQERCEKEEDNQMGSWRKKVSIEWVLAGNFE
jgi:hypothetical protein